MTTVYTVIHEDTHFDTEATVFSTPEKALSYAISVLEDMDRKYENVDCMSEEGLKEAGWLLCGNYGESGYVWVVPTIVDERQP